MRAAEDTRRANESSKTKRPSDRIRQPLVIITPGAYVIRYPDSSSTKRKPRDPKIARFLSPSVMELPPKP